MIRKSGNGAGARAADKVVTEDVDVAVVVAFS